MVTTESNFIIMYATTSPKGTGEQGAAPSAPGSETGLCKIKAVGAAREHCTLVDTTVSQEATG